MHAGAHEDSVLAQLRGIDVDSHKVRTDRILHEVLLDEVERNVGVRVCRRELWGVTSYVNGWQASLTDLARIQPYPEFRARAGAPGQYQPPPDDGSRPPIHLVNTRDPTHKSRADIESTTFHETWPGHHQQLMVARAAKSQHPLVRLLFNSGFGEGWALYAERVADEVQLYSGDLDRFGYLAGAKFRAARMVIDAGIHTRGMGYEEAQAFLGEQSTLSKEQVRGEVNRYISWPGQAPSYMIGNLEILRLRDAARNRLSERFDIRAFHDQVLGHGSVTLPLLHELLYEWLDDDAKGSPAAAAKSGRPMTRERVRGRPDV